MNVNAMPLVTEAERYLEQKDYDRAAVAFSRIEELTEGSTPVARVGLARVALALHRVDEAKAILAAALLKFPRCGEAIALQGVIEEIAGERDAAMGCYLRALVADPTVALAHANLGRCYAQLERWELSAASYTLAIQHGLETAEVKTHLGTALFRAGKPAEALKVLTLTVNAHPKHLDAILTLADVLVERGALGLAAELLDNAAPRLPDEALIPSRRAAIALRMKDLEAAQREARRHVELAPEDEEAWLFLAVVDTMRLHFDSAERALKYALKLNPECWRAHYHLGGLADALRQPAKAKRSYRAALRINPLAWEPMNNLAIVLLEEGTADALREARTLLDQAIRFELTPDSVITHYNLALACLRLGDGDAARRHATNLLKLAPTDHPMATEAQRLLRVA
ncbi:MAG: tetratricopeptide repeat protein [Myxococcaceae bacterium]